MSDPTPEMINAAVEVYWSDGQYDDVEQLTADVLRAALAEWQCPSCGATTRARMADQEVRLCPGGCNCRYGTDDAEGDDCACGGPCQFDWPDDLPTP